MFWQGVGKKDVWLNGNFFFGSASSRWQTTVLEQHLDYWTKDNPDAYYPRPYLTQAGVDKPTGIYTLLARRFILAVEKRTVGLYAS